MKTFIANKNIMANIKVYDSRISGYFCDDFIDFMFKDQTLRDFIHLILPQIFEKNNKVTI